MQRATTQEIVQTQCANQANTLEQTCAQWLHHGKHLWVDLLAKRKNKDTCTYVTHDTLIEASHWIHSKFVVSTLVRISWIARFTKFANITSEKMYLLHMSTITVQTVFLHIDMNCFSYPIKCFLKMADKSQINSYHMPKMWLVRQTTSLRLKLALQSICIL